MSARPFKSFLDAVARSLGYKVAGPLDYLARYPGRVVAQSADFTRLDVQLDLDVEGSARRMPSPSGVSIRLGLPGIMVGIQTGCRVLVGWEQGDPDRPYIADWELGATVNRLTADAGEINLNDGTNGAARIEDPTGSGAISVALHTVSSVPTGFFFFTPEGSTPTVTFTPNAAPVPVPPTALWFQMLLGLPVVPPDTLVPLSLPGKITDGSASVIVGG